MAGDVNSREAAIKVIQRAIDHYNDTFLGNTTGPVDGRFDRFGGSDR